MPPSFSPKEDFKEGQFTYEAGNKYDPEKYGLTVDDLKRFHGHGWAEVEGWDPAPERQVIQSVEVVADKSEHTQEVEAPSG